MASGATLSAIAKEMEETNTERSSDEIPFLSNQTPSHSMDQTPTVIKQEEPAKDSDLSSKIVADEVALLSKLEKIQEGSPSPSSCAVQRSAPISSESLKEMEIKYAAYVRHDSYGTMGRGRVSLKEKALLLFALLTLVPLYSWLTL